ncbi:amino acid adenylation domain-containing protein, partial [Tenacibaculum sp. 190524A02b]
NGITTDTESIVPAMVPLLDFGQEDIDKVVASVKGGVSNIQDMYPLSPLQEGMYFHHLMSDKEAGDPYILPSLLSFKDKEKRELFINALQSVVNRHDVLRTCVLSKDLPSAVQVVLREAKLPVEELVIDSSKDIVSELKTLVSPENQWMDVSKGPLIRLKLAEDLDNDCYYLIFLAHHLVLDHVGLEKIILEVEIHASGKGSNLPVPALYRDFIGHTLHSQSINDSAAYFKNLLGDIDEPTYPFELSNTTGGGVDIEESKVLLPKELSKKLRKISTSLGMSPATLFHAAYGLVVGKCSNKDYAIFGSLFLGRLQGTLGAADSLGLFINTLPIFVELKGNVSEYVSKVKKGLEELLSYEQTPLSSIQTWSNISNEIPLFSALLNYRHSSISSNSEEDETTVDLGITLIDSHERTNYPFTFSVDDYGVDFGLKAQIERSIGADRILVYMQEALVQILEGLTSEKELNVESLTIISRTEEVKLLETFNDNIVEYPKNKTVLDLLEEQIAKTPEAIAVVYKEEQLTYRELDNRSNQLAQYLINKGVGENDFVGICLDRSLEMLVGILGVLKSGSAYVPIDPKYPQDRINYMLNDASINLVLSNTIVSKEVLGEQPEITIILLDNDWNAISTLATDKTKYISSNNLAYVIYTSGSTGKPKGVPIRHKSLINYITSSSNSYIGEGVSGGYMHLSMSFDASMTEIFTPLVNGKLLVISSGEGLDIFKDKNLWKHAPYDFIKLTPSHLELLSSVLEEDNSILSHKYVLGGEALQPSHLSAFKDLNISSTIINEYGPTEATVGCTTYTFNALDKHSFVNSFPIGTPMPNMQLYILNDSNQLVPKGVVGELCIGGVGLSSGYLNREKLTQEKFIENPFKEDDKIYKTGDLGKWLPDGNIEYVGRKDDQVKIRGYRIELGEIENVLSKLPTVSQCCVLAKEDTSGDKRLVGYVVSEETFDKETIQLQLKTSLPDYMIPNLWVELEEMPLTNNGKLNRKALPDPDGEMLSTREYVAPRNETEQQLVAIWQELLGVEKIGVYDNFFELGGHSLLATRLVSIIRKKFEFDIMIKDIFKFVNIEELGTYLEHRKIKKQENTDVVYKKIVKI